MCTEKEREYQKQWRKQNLQRKRELIRIYRLSEEYKLKERIRAKTYRIASALKDFCSCCGSKEKLELHHNSYAITDFRILCSNCHNKIHSGEKYRKWD
jgi:hypothetical protein